MRYEYRVTLTLTDDPNEEPAMSTYPTYEEAQRVIGHVIGMSPCFDPMITIRRVTVSD